MKVLLYNPPSPSSELIIRRYMCSYNADDTMYPVIDLLGLAAAARSWGHRVSYLDCTARRMTRAEAIAEAREFAPDAVLSMGGHEHFYADTRELLALKRALPGAAVGVMGHVATLYPERTLALGLDFVLRGEPEPGWKTLLGGGTGGVGLATPGSIGEATPRQTAAELGTHPVAAHDLIERDLYFELGLGRPLTAVQLSRGCAFACTFCVKTYGRGVAKRPLEHVLEELTLIHRLGIRHVRMFDDTFNLDRKWMAAVLEGMLSRGLDLGWSAYARVDTLDAASLALMRRAGCRRLYVGIESGSDRVLRSIKKGYDADGIAERVRLVRRAGIECLGFFLVGTAEETWDDIRASIRLAKACDLDFLVVSKLVAYPGTELGDNIGTLARVDPWTGEYEPSADLDRDRRMERWKRDFYRAFYLSPQGLRLGLRMSLRDPARTLKMSWSFLRYSVGGHARHVLDDYMQ